jgi:MFS family permease
MKEKSSKNVHKSSSKSETISWIKSQKIMWKFRFYGFFKNLKFFEPYLLIILLSWGLNLFQIGVLIAIQEGVSFIFEIPSGMIADNKGRKSEMLLCFIFYIISFYFYFLGPNFLILIFAAIFFGLGEAFRSGTHKAMEMQWLDENNIPQFKSYVYGSSRSYSLYGSAISSLLAIVFILSVPASRWIFLLTIIPYIIDFVLISTYPKYMNKAAHMETNLNHREEFFQSLRGLKVLFINRKLSKGLFSSSVYNSIFKSLKDYIQPLLQLMILFLLADLGLANSTYNQDFYLAVLLGLIYALFYLISSYSSKKSYKFEEIIRSPKKSMDLLFYIFGAIILIEAIFISLNLPFMIITFYLLIYISYNIRRPITVGYLGDKIEIKQRTTILSVESQLRTIFVIVFAPLFGFLAEAFSIGFLFYILSIAMIIFNFLFLKGE